MKIENIINIKGVSLEEKIKRTIDETKDELSGLTTETTCMIYSSYLSENLRREHIAHEIVSTKEYEYPYEHIFIVVPKDEKSSYIVDLTYEQFQSNKFPELLQKGYILIKEGEQLRNYLDVVGNVNINERKKH